MKTPGRSSAVFILMVLLGLGIHLLGDQTFMGPRSTAAAQPEQSSSHACSLETIEGAYGTSTSGSIVSGGPVGLVAEAGVITFDGDGGVSQTATVDQAQIAFATRNNIKRYIYSPADIWRS
jgi:hypothetical protein